MFEQNVCRGAVIHQDPPYFIFGHVKGYYQGLIVTPGDSFKVLVAEGNHLFGEGLDGHHFLTGVRAGRRGTGSAQYYVDNVLLFPRTFSLVCCVPGDVLSHVAFADLLFNEVLEGYAVFRLVTVGAMIVTMPVSGSALWRSLHRFWWVVEGFVSDFFEYILAGSV